MAQHEDDEKKSAEELRRQASSQAGLASYSGGAARSYPSVPAPGTPGSRFNPVIRPRPQQEPRPMAENAITEVPDHIRAKKPKELNTTGMRKREPDVSTQASQFLQGRNFAPNTSKSPDMEIAQQKAGEGLSSTNADVQSRLATGHLKVGSRPAVAAGVSQSAGELKPRAKVPTRRLPIPDPANPEGLLKAAAGMAVGESLSDVAVPETTDGPGISAVEEMGQADSNEGITSNFVRGAMGRMDSERRLRERRDGLDAEAEADAESPSAEPEMSDKVKARLEKHPQLKDVGGPEPKGARAQALSDAMNRPDESQDRGYGPAGR